LVVAEGVTTAVQEDDMSSKLRRLLVFASFGCVLVVLATAGVQTQSRWVRLAPFPEPSEELYGTTANGKMYVLGGFGQRTGMVFEYDPAADRWTRKANMARPVHHQAMVPYNGKIYVFGGFANPTAGGGWEPVDNAWEYDPATDAWKALAPMPLKRGSAVAAEVGGRMYVLGGATTYPKSQATAIAGNGPALVLTVNQVYDPATNTWAERSPMSVGRNHAYAGAVGGKIYVIGGRIGHAFVGASSPTDVVEEYDPATDTWSGLRAKMPTPRSGGGWATYNGKIYVAGGEIATPQLVGAFRAIEVYNPATNTWDTTFPAMPIPRHGVAGAVIGNRFHLVSGQITSAAAGGGGDPQLRLYVQVHDAIDLQ
jgi:N-acetylneuraminic acid mutarotase